MKTILILFCCLAWPVSIIAQIPVNDQSIRYQQQRMVFLQWDQNKFTPKPGFLSLNPYYWLVWGITDPNYHKKDLRPLSPGGPQSQRIALVSSMRTINGSSKLQTDTLRATAQSQIGVQSGLLSTSDPLWIFYYSKQLAPLMNHSAASVLAGLPPPVVSALVSGGYYAWFNSDLDMLSQRLDGARTSDMDRGSRIMAYYRILKEYRALSGIWSSKIASAAATIAMTQSQLQLKSGGGPDLLWKPETDLEIARRILQQRKY